MSANILILSVYAFLPPYLSTALRALKFYVSKLPQTYILNPLKLIRFEEF